MNTKNQSAPDLAYYLGTPSNDFLYPEVFPRYEESIPVGDGHHLWLTEYGNPSGRPAIVVHGGPGAGCTARDARFFDPDFYRIILLDQRGAGRSTPSAETRENTTWHLVADMETIRKKLGIEQWLVFGGSWGSALSMAYGQLYPNRCLGFVLRGIFLGTAVEYLKLWNEMGDFYPEVFEDFKNFIPLEEQEDLLNAYHQRLINNQPEVHLPAARSFARYDYTCATLLDKSIVENSLANTKIVLALARLFAHYSKNQFFFSADQLLKNLSAITHLPAILVHGRYDIICRPTSAWQLHKAWPQSHLSLVADAGHASIEPGITRELRLACDKMKILIK